MTKDLINLEVLSTRTGFNLAVKHIKQVIEIIDSVGPKNNLADLLYEMGDEAIAGEQASLLLRMFLIDKLGYKSVSTNLASVANDIPALAKAFEKWKAVDLVVAYRHPEMGFMIANPKVPEELAQFGDLRKRELLIVYAGKGSAPSDDSCQKAAELAASMFEGSKSSAPSALLKGNFTVRKLKAAKTAREKAPAARKKAAPARASKRGAPAKAPPGATSGGGAKLIAAYSPMQDAGSAAPASQGAAARGPVKMTPRYAVVVQNELFHNGNVEAWKRIVTSYKAKYPQLEVYIFYDGERILDINSLFKWGKVKHGSAIEFAVAGNDIKDVAKLQRYLTQGASNMFEAFLKGPVNTVLRLFG